MDATPGLIPTTTIEYEVSGTDQRTAHLNHGTDPDHSSNVIPHTVKLSEFNGSNHFSLSAVWQRVSGILRFQNSSFLGLATSLLALAPSPSFG